MFLFISKQCDHCKILLDKYKDQFVNMNIIDVDPVLKNITTDDRLVDWNINAVPTLVTASPSGNGLMKKVGVKDIVGID